MRDLHEQKDTMAELQQLLRFSFSPTDAQQALKAEVPAMRAGFNVNTYRGNMSVNGDDAQALADLLEERLRHRLASRTRANKASPVSSASLADEAELTAVRTTSGLRQ